MTKPSVCLAPVGAIWVLLILGLAACGGGSRLGITDEARPHATSSEGPMAGNNPTIAIGPEADLHILYEESAEDTTERLWHAWRTPANIDWVQEVVAVRPAPYPDTGRLELFNTEADSAIGADGSLWVVWGIHAGAGGVDIWAYNKTLGGDWTSEIVFSGLAIPATGVDVATCPDGSVAIVVAENSGVVRLATKPAGGGGWEVMAITRPMHFPSLSCQEGNLLSLVGIESTVGFVVGTLGPGGAWDWSEVPAAIGPDINRNHLAPPVIDNDGTYHLVVARENGLLHAWGSKAAGWETNDSLVMWYPEDQVNIADPRLVLLEDGRVVVFFRGATGTDQEVYGAAMGDLGALRNLTKVFGAASDLDLARDSSGGVHLAVHALPTPRGKPTGALAYLKVDGLSLEYLFWD